MFRKEQISLFSENSVFWYTMRKLFLYKRRMFHKLYLLVSSIINWTFFMRYTLSRRAKRSPHNVLLNLYYMLYSCSFCYRFVKTIRAYSSCAMWLIASLAYVSDWRSRPVLWDSLDKCTVTPSELFPRIWSRYEGKSLVLQVFKCRSH